MTIEMQQAQSLFESIYGSPAELIARAPGRVNIIGEHTDYNHGFVLPMAIDRETLLLARPRDDRRLAAHAANLGMSCEKGLDVRSRDPQNPWADYILGVAEELAKLGKPLRGADLLIIGDVPIGAGLSSSASLEMAALVLFEAMGDFHIEEAEAPKLGQRVENEYLGLSSGIMDQFIIRMGRAGHALFLDCRSHEYDLIPVAFDNACFVIANTGVSRGLTSSKYNERVAECAQAVDALREATRHQGTHLRDFSLSELGAARSAMPDVVFRRACHVISEDTRTQAACEAMRKGDAPALGVLMDESDHSLREDYEVTCEELDTMNAIARSVDGCYGSRMTGAGFGGCIVSLVQADRADAFGEQLLASYRERTGLEGELIVSTPAEGAGLMRR